MSQFLEALDRIDILVLAEALGFPRPKAGRTRCILHEGDSPYSFSLDQAKGVWHCFACKRQGGKLQLVIEALRLDKKAAVQWLADYAGVKLEHQTPKQRQDWIKERKRLERRRPAALCWRSAFTILAEELLDYLKGLPVDQLARDEIFQVEKLHRRVEFLDGPLLLDEFASWKKHTPRLTGQLVRIGIERQKLVSYALNEFLKAE